MRHFYNFGVDLRLFYCTICLFWLALTIEFAMFFIFYCTYVRVYCISKKYFWKTLGAGLYDSPPMQVVNESSLQIVATASFSATHEGPRIINHCENVNLNTYTYNHIHIVPIHIHIMRNRHCAHHRGLAI